LQVRIVEHLITCFLEEIQKITKKLAAGIEDKNYSNMELFAHSLKGSGANMV